MSYPDSNDNENNDKAKHVYHDHSLDMMDDPYGLNQMKMTMLRRSDSNYQEAFPIKLHNMLDQVEKDGKAAIVSWQPHGRCFVVHNQEEFQKQIMPKFFKGRKFSSFQRQLNLYGFQRITSGRDKGGYYHELFLKHRLFLCHRIRRVRIKGTGVRKASCPESEPNFYAMPIMQLQPEQQADAPASPWVFGNDNLWNNTNNRNALVNHITSSNIVDLTSTSTTTPATAPAQYASRVHPTPHILSPTGQVIMAPVLSASLAGTAASTSTTSTSSATSSLQAQLELAYLRAVLAAANASNTRSTIHPSSTPNTSTPYITPASIQQLLATSIGRNSLHPAASTTGTSIFSIQQQQQLGQSGIATSSIQQQQQHGQSSAEEDDDAEKEFDSILSTLSNMPVDLDQGDVRLMNNRHMGNVLERLTE